MAQLPEYPWFDKAPAHLKTRKQLAAEGLVPTGQPVALVVWRGGRRTAQLYDPTQTRPKQAATPAQLAALEKARAATEAKRWTCGGCGLVVVGGLDEDGICDTCIEQAMQAEADAARRKAARWSQKMLAGDVVLVDVETTRLENPDIVQIAILHVDGRVLLDTLVRPSHPIDPGAQAVHGITDAMVATAPPLLEIADQIEAAIVGRTVIAYNAPFDHGALRSALERAWDPEQEIRSFDRYDWSRAWVDRGTWVDAMPKYSAYVGEWSEYHGDFKWQRLPGGDHTAMGDCRALLAVLQRMAAEVQEPTLD
jgi:DNA polymerase III subunit epsilon